MKLFDFAGAPNPTKVRVYLAEKGLAIPIEPVDILSGQNRTPAFLAEKNPLGGLPVLELDDGSCLTESLAIIEYFEELHPEPALIGTTPLGRARVREVERIAEFGVLGSIGTIFQNTSPLFAGRVKQSPQAAENAATRLGNALRVLDVHAGRHAFLAADRPTIADCTLFAGLKFGEFAGVALDPAHANLARWYDAFKARPSAAA